MLDPKHFRSVISDYTAALCYDDFAFVPISLLLQNRLIEIDTDHNLYR